MDNKAKLANFARTILKLISMEHMELLHAAGEQVIAGDYTVDKYWEFVELFDKAVQELAELD